MYTVDHPDDIVSTETSRSSKQINLYTKLMFTLMVYTMIIYRHKYIQGWS